MTTPHTMPHPMITCHACHVCPVPHPRAVPHDLQLLSAPCAMAAPHAMPCPMQMCTMLPRAWSSGEGVGAGIDPEQQGEWGMTQSNGRGGRDQARTQSSSKWGVGQDLEQQQDLEWWQEAGGTGMNPDFAGGSFSWIA